jgi:hypothetical protein
MAVQPDRSCAVADEAGYGAHDIPQELPHPSSI